MFKHQIKGHLFGLPKCRYNTCFLFNGTLAWFFAILAIIFSFVLLF